MTREAELLHFGDSHTRADEVVANRVVDQLDNGVDSQFAHDRSAVSFDRLDTDTQHGGDFFIPFCFGEQLDDFALPIRKDGVLFTASGFQETLEHCLRRDWS